MLFIDFRFVRFVEANPVYEADVTNGEVVDAIDNGDFVVARLPMVTQSGPNAGRRYGYELLSDVYYSTADRESSVAIELDFYSPQRQGLFSTDPDFSAATDKLVIRDITGV